MSNYFNPVKVIQTDNWLFELKKNIEELKKRINNTLKIKIKEASIKVPVGKQSMEDKDIIENIGSIYEAIEQALPKKKDNVKNISLKFTMTKPQRINVK